MANETIEIDGVAVQVEGEGAETIVMMHGWPDTHRLWDAQVAALAPHYRCVRFTLPGFDITKPRRAMSLARMIDFVRRVVDAVSPDRPVVMMLHDWGCLYGYQFIVQHPDLVAAIVGVDVGDAGSRDHVKTLDLRAKLAIAAYQLALVAAWRLGGRLGDRLTRATARWVRSPSPQAHIGAHMNYPYDVQWMGSHGSFKGARRFAPHCPMLFVYGQRKPFMFHSPQWAEAIASRAGSAVQALPTGHWVMTSQPQAFNEVVLRWLRDGRFATAG